MPVTTRIRAYVLAAMKRAIYESDEGTVSGSIPLFPGILAFGDDSAECESNLSARITDWVSRALSNGYRLPIIDGIDLNAEKGHGSARRRHRDAKANADEFYPSEGELEAAFTRVDESLAK